MQFMNFNHDTASIVQVTILVSTVQRAARLYRQTWCVEIWSHLHILREREREGAHGDSLTPLMTLCLRETFQITL